MSSEETCLQGFPNDDIFGVIEFAFMQIKAVGLRCQRTITVERKRGNLGVSRKNQASDIAKLWREFLSLLY